MTPRAVIGLVALGWGALGTACVDTPAAPEGPFTLRIAAQVGETGRAVLEPGEDVEMAVGETLVLEVQVLGGDGSPASVQSSTVGETSNPRVLPGVGAVFDVDRSLARFVFTGRSPGVSAVGFENAPAELGTVVLVRVAGASERSRPVGL